MEHTTINSSMKDTSADTNTHVHSASSPANTAERVTPLKETPDSSNRQVGAKSRRDNEEGDLPTVTTTQEPGHLGSRSKNDAYASIYGDARPHGKVVGACIAPGFILSSTAAELPTPPPADDKLYGHLSLNRTVLSGMGYKLPTIYVAPNHPASPHTENKLAEHCRILDLGPDADMDIASQVLEDGGGIHTLRAGEDHDLHPFPQLPPTLVISCPTLSYAVAPYGIPEGPLRVVLNISAPFPDWLLGCDIGFKSIPTSVKELVLHFPINGYIARPRYAVVQRTFANGRYSDESIALLKTSDPIPTLGPNQYIALMPFAPVEPEDCLFDKFAVAYRNSVGTGLRKRKDNPLKLFLVGLDDLERARASEAADDAAFSAMLDKLPWGRYGPPEYQRPPHGKPLATVIIDVLAKAAKADTEQVAEHVKVMSAPDYAAHIGPDGCEVEDWTTLPKRFQGRRSQHK